MYEVFINDSSLILSETIPENRIHNWMSFEEINLLDLIKQLEHKSSSFFLLCTDVEISFQKLKHLITPKEAAGGWVTHTKTHKTLFIVRNDVWDLPKGHVEKGETIKEAALREVHEECGIDSLTLKDFLTTTYHIFREEESFILKISHWFHMTTDQENNLTPQLEEGITGVKFLTQQEVNKALKNTYENIKLVAQSYDEKAM